MADKQKLVIVQPLSDVAVAEAVWRPGDRRVLYTTPDYGLVSLLELDVATGVTRTIFEAMSFQSISFRVSLMETLEFPGSLGR